MSSKSKPIELMHRYYGVAGGVHVCGECCNLVTIVRNGKKFRKCRAYGVTCSNRSDWAKRWEACALFDKPIHYQLISDDAKRIFNRIGISDYDISQIKLNGVE